MLLWESIAGHYRTPKSAPKVKMFDESSSLKKNPKIIINNFFVAVFYNFPAFTESSSF